MIREELVRVRLESFANTGAAVTDDMTSEEKSDFHRRIEAYQGMMSAARLFIGAVIGIKIKL